MEPQRDERKLTTILAADVVGFSRLMGEDEAGTLNALKADRKELIEPKAAQYHGRIVKLLGDGILMEFTSVVDAVLFGVEVQCALRERNAAMPDDRQIVYRIGINIGDIIVDGDDIYGDGVNVAARLEGLAEPGGICIQRNVRDQIRDKLDLTLEDLGEVEVKNIARPIRVFSVVLDDKAEVLVTPVRAAPIKTGHRRWVVAAAAAVALVAAVGGVFWWQPWVPGLDPASLDKMAFPLPDKPSIAVLPFTNMSEDPGQEYFADGMTEDLITDLSKISGLFVIARTSTFTYKGKSVKVREIAQELGVRYVLEGSVRLAGDRVRINAQLIDATTGGHLWAERYDRDLGDIFALQDEIAGKIVKALEVKLAAGEQEQVARRYTDNLKAYDFFLRGRAYWRRRTGVFGKDQATEQAQQMFEKAIELDPKFAAAYAELSITHWRLRAIEGPQAKERAFEAAQKAVALDDSLPLAHTRLGWMYLWKKQHQQAIAEAKRAIALDPGFAEGYAVLASILNWSLRPEEGIVLVKKAMRLEPHVSFWYVFTLGQSYYLMGQSEEAIAALKRSNTLNPDYSPTHRHLAVLYIELDRKDEARAEVAEILRIKPKDSLELATKYCFYKNNPAENRLKRFERFIDGMRKAGMPEKSRSTKL